jgi:hypothetical protein
VRQDSSGGPYCRRHRGNNRSRSRRASAIENFQCQLARGVPSLSRSPAAGCRHHRDGAHDAVPPEQRPIVQSSTTCLQPAPA